MPQKIIKESQKKIIKESQKKKWRSWIILGKHKITGEYVGIVEHSFSMGIDKHRVRVYKEWEILYSYVKKEMNRREKTTESLKHYKGSIQKYNKFHPDYNFNIYRVGTKKCPVSINWIEYHNSKKKKFEQRNLLFKVKKLSKQNIKNT